MFRRLFWLLIGLGFGFGTSFWMMRFVRETMARFSPERVSSDLADAVKGLGTDLRSAMTEGRVAMREREADLRSDVHRTR